MDKICSICSLKHKIEKSRKRNEITVDIGKVIYIKDFLNKNKNTKICRLCGKIVVRNNLCEFHAHEFEEELKIYLGSFGVRDDIDT